MLFRFGHQDLKPSLRGDPSKHTHTSLRTGYLSAGSHHQIFEALERLKLQTPGRGWEPTVVRGILEGLWFCSPWRSMMNGKISLDSKAGRTVLRLRTGLDKEKIPKPRHCPTNEKAASY